MLSKVVFFVSWCAVAFATCATAWWVWNVFFVDYNFLFDVVFTIFTAPVNIAVLVLAVIPSSILHYRTQDPRYQLSMVLSGCSFVVVLLETVLVWTVVRLHGA